MIDGLIAGRLMGDPERRQGKGDTTFVVARVKDGAADVAADPLQLPLRVAVASG